MRKFHAFVIGLPNSGNDSVSMMFGKRYKVRRDPFAEEFIDIIMEGNVKRIDKFLLQKHGMGYELENSMLNGLVANRLASLFPDAKFLLPLRDCTNWVSNAIVHRQNSEETWKLLFDWMLAKYGFDFAKEEEKVSERSCYPLKNYFQAWSEYHSFLLEVIPRNRIIWVKYFDVNCERGKIAQFLKIPIQDLEYGMEKTHPVNLDIPYEYLRSLMKICDKERAVFNLSL